MSGGISAPFIHRPIATTLLMAAVRGLMMDLLATGDRERVDDAFELLLAGVRDRIEEWSADSVPGGRRLDRRQRA